MKRSVEDVLNLGATMKDPGNLSAAADRAAALAAECDAAVSALEAEEAEVKARLEACLTGGAGGKDVRALADQRDDLQRKLASRRQDAGAAKDGAVTARAKAEGVRLGVAVTALNAETRASDEMLESLLSRLAAAWTARLTISAKGTALQKELLAARRAHKVPIPELAESALTSDLLVLAESVGPGLDILKAEREDAKRPRAPYRQPVPEPVAEPSRHAQARHI